MEAANAAESPASRAERADSADPRDNGSLHASFSAPCTAWAERPPGHGGENARALCHAKCRGRVRARTVE
ncbi:unnamed protein product [Lampetra planeri]